MKVKYLTATLLLIGVILTTYAISFAQSAPADMKQKLNVAISYVDNMDYEQAITLFNEIIASAGEYQGPETSQAHKFLGVAYFALDKKDLAYQEFVKALTINRNLFLDPNSSSPEMIELLERAKGNLRSMDMTPPAIEPLQVKSGTVGKPVEIEAKVTDDMGISDVLLYYRVSGSGSYRSMKMTEFMKGYFVGKIPGDQVTSSGIQYYIEAYDASGRPPTTHGSSAQPMIVSARKLYPVRNQAMQAAGWTTFVIGIGGLGTGVAYSVSASLTQDEQAKWNKEADDANNRSDKDKYRNRADKYEFWWREYEKYSFIAYGVGSAFLITSGVLLAVDAAQTEKERDTAYKKRNWDIIPTISPDYAGVLTILRF